MRYEWDEAKRATNLEKHGYDLAEAKHIYEHPNVMTLQSKYLGETRYVDLAEWGGRLLALVYTMRAGTVRAISLRPAKRRERRLYYGKDYP